VALAGILENAMFRREWCLLLALVLPIGALAESARLEKVLAPFVADRRFAGVVAWQSSRGSEKRAVGEAWREGQVAHHPKQRFKLHSLSKWMTATVVLRLVDVGKLGLDDGIRDRVPGLPAAWETVQLRHLLQHSSGIPDLSSVMVDSWDGDTARTLSAMDSEMAAASLQFPPGTKFAYSNFGFVLLGRAIEVASGKPYAEVMQQELFDPSGMKSASIERAPSSGGYSGPPVEVGLANGYNGSPQHAQVAMSEMYKIAAAGGVIAAADDVTAFALALFQGDLLKPETRALMLARSEQLEAPVGLGVFIGERNGETVYRHDGGNNGYTSNLSWMADSETAVVVLSNLGFAPIGDLRAAIESAVQQTAATRSAEDR
jgi:D-alanyl-D-alanine carboxypeptidase